MFRLGPHLKEDRIANQDKPGTSKRGFASMDEEKQREIARKGGESVPPEQRSFSKDRELAAEAGRKGGEASSRMRAGVTNAANNDMDGLENAVSGQTPGGLNEGGNSDRER